MAELLEKALAARTETDAIDFKREFNPGFDGDWCELVKDVVAIGNSGGGAIVVGVDRAGVTVGVEAGLAKTLDPATVGDKLRKYTGGSHPRCTVSLGQRDSSTVLVLLIGECVSPVAFERAGTYLAGERPKCAFHEGTFYFRHNTKSEPGLTEDIEAAIERQIERHRQEWVENIRRVMEAPAGSVVSVTSLPITVTGRSQGLAARLTNEAGATPIAYRSRDDSHPYRFKELHSVVGKRLPPGISLSTGDLFAIRRAYNVHANPNWADVSKHAPTQYSDAFADWLVENCSRDPRFAAKTRAKARREGKSPSHRQSP
jgi:hypothetical protein